MYTVFVSEESVCVSDISVDIGLKLHGQAVEKRNHVDMLSTCRVVPPEDLCLLTCCVACQCML